MNTISNIKRVSNSLDIRTTSWFSIFGVIGAVAIVAMMLIIVVDALGRRFLSLPVYGSYELTIFLLIIVFFSSFTYCTILKGHFLIDIVTSHFPKRARSYIVAIMYIISAAVCFLLTSQLAVYAIKVEASNLTGAQFNSIPMYIFVLFGVICTAIAGWGFLLQFVAYIIKAVEGE
jgi:TRAP-type C4-dicarboxylate transport system permease small subunit